MRDADGAGAGAEGDWLHGWKDQMPPDSIRNGLMSGIISYMFFSIHDGKKEMLHAYLYMDRYRFV